MHIEINAGSLGGGIVIAEYQSNMSSFISDAESVISSFKAVSNSTYALNGGVGILESAVRDISSGVQKEIQKKNDAIAIQKKSNDFLDLAVRIDNKVSMIVNKNKDEFYRVNPWLKPVAAVYEEIPWYEQAWSWLCGTCETIVDEAKQAWNWVSDTAKKAWNGIVEFYQEHKKVIDSILIVVGAVGAIAAVVVTGGVALAPLLGALGVSTATAVAISTAVAVTAVISTIGASVLNLVDIWCEIDSPIFNFFQKALNIVSTVTNLVYSIGNSYNSLKSINPQEYVANHSATSNVTTSELTFDSSKSYVKTSESSFDENITLGQDKFSSERFYSQGNHYDEFSEFWESGMKEYSYVKADNSPIEYVNSKDIEGVFLNKNEVKNSNVFWNKRYSKSEYLDYVASGKMINNPIEVTKVNDSFYYFHEEGRHRILAAQILNIKIPVIIKGLYVK